MWTCPECGTQISDGARCPRCKTGDPRFYENTPDRAQPKALPPPQPPQSTIITDIRIPFGRWVGIMVKMSLAAVPAAIIVAVIWAFIVALLPGFIAGLR